MNNCVHCGKTAISLNAKGQPTCKKHKEKSPKQVSCSVCGEDMVIRSGRYGYFWGCSGYPECRVTEQVRNML